MTALVLGHKNPDTDSIVSALSAANLYRGRGIDVKTGAQGKPAPETAFVLERFGLTAPEVVTSVAGEEVYLVDYSDLAQAPDDFAKCKLLGIIDHHKLGDVTSDSPVEVFIKPVGCSNTVIKELHDIYDVSIDPKLAGAMMCAILSDTVLFKSPTCTEADKKAVADLAKIAGVDNPLDIGMEMFKAKSNLSGASARDLIFRDFKDFDMSGNKVGIGQLELVSLSLITPELKAQLQDELNKVKAEGRHSAVLVITDIMKEGSELMMCSDNGELIAKALNTQVSDEMWMPGVMSRKKQVVPNLEQAFKA
ncbi:manganese-dependent inorganic pyrophosphatase [Anaerobiospirillum succiniciproducens]|uniref:manganese-dependent inorganic pyrophosphatase n=1 Tax=Anaerobiospirillum succiniciproducens TaxID=13335 RepID=UPI0023576995|nr:manganese-dependent inorganic pyrophosphatase [Anaerobiospirillum succiniciproducens]MCI6862761.1 manganese-dependent inorganic pyrophosphatase [Anaerobiospirillum succiniciproducens]